MTRRKLLSQPQIFWRGGECTTRGPRARFRRSEISRSGWIEVEKTHDPKRWPLEPAAQTRRRGGRGAYIPTAAAAASASARVVFRVCIRASPPSI